MGRVVGGVVDAVLGSDDRTRHPPEGLNGVGCEQSDYYSLESASDRAIGLWYNYHDEVEKRMIQGMNCDSSWKYPAKDYVEIYEQIRHK